MFYKALEIYPKKENAKLNSEACITAWEVKKHLNEFLYYVVNMKTVSN